MSHAKPVLKFAGGKTKLLPSILPRLPTKIGTYYEPFVGGGAVFFALASENRFERAILSDVNEELMRTYGALRLHPNAVICALKNHPHEERYYYTLRGMDPCEFKAPEQAARFIYLNRTCFNGLYRVNKSGKFNVPFGDYKNPTICDEENLRAVSAVLKNTTLTVLDFERSVETAKRGDAVYFDPPYVPASKTSNFTAYAKEGFTAGDHERLRDCAEKLVGRGVHVLLSNSDTQFVRELYCSFRIEEVKARRNINSKGNNRGAVGELLISGREL